MFYELLTNIGGKASAEDVIAELKKVFIPLGVRVNYDGDRVILCVNRGRMNFRSPIQYECNGIVLDISGGQIRVLAVPPKTLSTVYTANYLMKNLADYEITPVCDGTTLTLYYDDGAGRWRLATRTAIDVTEKVWGTRKYIDIMRELCSWDTILATANKSYSYSFGFHHSDYHPFNIAGAKPVSPTDNVGEYADNNVGARANLDRGTFNQCENRNSTTSARINNSVRVVNNRARTYQYMPASNSIWHVETIDRTTGNTVEEKLFDPQNILKNSVTSAEESKKLFSWLCSVNAESLDRAPETIHLGWILRRARSGPDYNNDNILIESTLGKFIRTNCYDFPRVPERNNVNWRMIYMILRALTKPTVEQFMALFPGITKYWAHCILSLEDLHMRIGDCSRDDVLDLKTRTFVVTAREALASVTGPHRESVVDDYILNVDNLEIVADIFTESPALANMN